MITGVEYYNACNYKLALIEFVKIESLEWVAIYISKCKEMIVELKKQEEILKLKEVEQKGIDKVKVEWIKLCRSGRYSSALVQFEKIANIDWIQQYINLCHEKINIAQEKQEEKKRTLGIREKGMWYYKKGAYIKALNEFRKIEGVTSVAWYIRNCNIHMMKAKRIEKEEKIREEKKKRALWIVQKWIDLFKDWKYENALREFERIESEAWVKKRVDACNKKINAIKETERRRVLEIWKKKSLINKRDLTDPVFLLTPSESTWNDRAPRDWTATKVTGKSRLLGKLLTEVLQARVRWNKVVKLQLDLEEALSTNYAVNIKWWWFERKVTLKVSESVREILEESEYIEKLKKFKLNLVRIGKK
jgi:hypothetical protein